MISNVQQIQADRQRRALKDRIHSEFNPSYATYELGDADISRLIELVMEPGEFDMGNYASQVAVDYMQAYYKVQFMDLQLNRADSQSCRLR